MDEVDRELDLLKTFSELQLQKNSFVYDKVQDLIGQAKREHARIKLSQTVTKAPEPQGFYLNVLINHPSIKERKTLTLVPGSTLAALKKALEPMLPAAQTVERILVRRTGKAWSQLDDKTIDQCEIKSGDDVVVECKNLMMESADAKGIGRIASSGVAAQTPFQLICLALHSYMLDLAFITIVELPSNVPGFAPSLKELPKNMFVPSSWNSKSQEVDFMYKHKSYPGKQFQIVCLDVGDSAMVTFAQRAGDVHNLELSVSNHTEHSPGDGIGFILTRPKELEESIRQFIYAALPALRPTPATTAPAPAQVYPSSVPPYGMIGPGGYPSQPVPPSVGGSDVHPFGPLYVGGPRGAGYNGNMVGPDHPMFSHDQEGNPFGAGVGGRGLPQPRFDPFGPILGPNQDIGGGGMGMGRGRGRGAGAGAGRGALFPGEPNNDHFRPPSW